MTRSRNLITSGMKGKSFPQLSDQDWMCGFVFFTDITQHMNELNINMQGTRGSFDCGQLQLRSNNMKHFPILSNEKSIYSKK
jgi:hypothetical protein